MFKIILKYVSLIILNLFRPCKINPKCNLKLFLNHDQENCFNEVIHIIELPNYTKS